MDGLDTILTALVVGAAAGSTEVAKSAIADTYTGLRDLLRRWLTSHPDAVHALDAVEADRLTLQTRLGHALAVTGADHDEQILIAARRLLEAAEHVGKYLIDTRDAKGVQIGDHNTQHNNFA